MRYCNIPRVELFNLISGGGSRLMSVHLSNAALREKWRSDEIIVDLGTRDATGRLVHLLLSLHKRLTKSADGENGRIPFPFRRVHLAEATGLTTVHIGRVLARLRAENLVVLEGETLYLPDPPALAAFADLRLEDLNPPAAQAA